KEGEIAQSGEALFEQVARPVPPGRSQQFGDYAFRESEADQVGGHTGDYRIRRDILRYYGRGAQNGARANGNPWHHNGTVSYPHVVADCDLVSPTPVEKSLLVLGGHAELGPAVGYVVLRNALHWMIARIEADVGRDRAELADIAVDDLVITGRVAVIADSRLDDRAIG